MKTVNWECIRAMLENRSDTIQDRDEFVSFGLSFCRDRLAVCEKNGYEPNFTLLIQWTVYHWFRAQAKRAAETNFGDEVSFIDERARPDQQVMVKLDTAQFMDELNDSQRSVLNMTLQGYTGQEIAQTMKRSAGRISQIRDEIRMKAVEFMPEYC